MSTIPNWQDVVNELLQTRTQTELSKEVGISQGTISEIKNGAIKRRLTYESGNALLELQKQDRAKAERSKAPSGN